MKNRLSGLVDSILAKIGWQPIVFVALTLGFAGIVFYGVRQYAPPTLTWEFIFLYIINAAVFLALFRHYPKLGLTMLVFILFFDLSILGYYYFSSISLLG